jgi:hypothetical protein
MCCGKKSWNRDCAHYEAFCDFREKLTTTYANGDAGDIVGIGKINVTTATEYHLTVPTGTDTTTTTDSYRLDSPAIDAKNVGQIGRQ